MKASEKLDLLKEEMRDLLDVLEAVVNICDNCQLTRYEQKYVMLAKEFIEMYEKEII